MERDEFLEKAWPRFPTAHPKWIDVSEFAENPRVRAIVCGRYRAGRIEFGGQSLGVKAMPRFDWLFAPLVPVGATLEFLRDDDLVAFRVGGLKGSTIHADAMALILPSKGGFTFNSAFGVERSKQWAKFTSTVRQFFSSRGFVEATTPTLVPSPGTEPFLDPFETKWEFGSQERKLYLPTSPEFHLKKMLAAGWPKLFEIKTCFRNGELGPRHQPEFQMLEWYRAFANLDRIDDDVEALIAATSAAFGLEKPKIERTTMRQLFAVAFEGFDLRPDTKFDDLRKLATNSGIGYSVSDDFDDLFTRLFIERVEPILAEKEVVVLRGYPPSQAALSRIAPDGFADRFEVFWRGVELANAFHELNDSDANEKRFKQDADKKIALGKPSVPTDEDLVAALRYGLPPSGGIALGLDRLFSSLLDLEQLGSTRPFPFET